mgnify:CR=1 FL=1
MYSWVLIYLPILTKLVLRALVLSGKYWKVIRPKPLHLSLSMNTWHKVTGANWENIIWMLAWVSDGCRLLIKMVWFIRQLK